MGAREVCGHGHVWPECYRCTPRLPPWHYRQNKGVRPVPSAMTMEEFEMAMSRAGSGTGGPDRGTAVDAQLQEACPCLHEWLSETKWDDGKKRETGSLMVVAEGGWWKMWIHDRDGRRSAWLAGGTLQDCLLAVEEGLSANTVAWRPDRR